MKTLQQILIDYNPSSTQLYLNNNQLYGEIPITISSFSSLEYIDLSCNTLSGEIPKAIYLTNLKELDLHNNNLSGRILKSLSTLTNLNELILYNNNLSGNIPHCISCLSNLKYLSLANNQLSGDIPIELYKLSNLQYLILNNNILSGSIPNSISSLLNLEYLRLNNNQLSSIIPNTITSLQNLKELWIHNNNFSGDIESSIINLQKNCIIKIENNNFNPLLQSSLLYTRIQVQNNPLYNPLDNIWDSKEFHKVEDYIDAIENEIDTITIDDIKSHIKKKNLIRVILLGAPEAGKTTLVNLIKNQIENNNKDNNNVFLNNNIATDGINISKIQTYSFWDFGGQETLYSTHQFFLSEESQYLIVVDLSKLIHDNILIRKTCIHYINYWMDELYSWTYNINSAPIILVGTHCDKLKGLFGLTSKIKKAENILLNMAKTKKLRFTNHVFKIANSKNTNLLVNDIFNQIKLHVNKYIISNRGLTEHSFKYENIKFFSLQKIIKSHRKKRQYMWWDEYIKLCSTCNIISNDEILKVTKYLVNFGVILTYRQESSGAGNLVILNPEWLAIAFTSIVSISFQSSNLRRGFFTREILENNWKTHNIPSNTWNELERLFEMFQMIIRLPNGKYYVPSMLNSKKQSKPPKEHNNRKEYILSIIHNDTICIQRIYKFTTIPYGLVERIVVRILHYPEMDINTTSWYNDYCIESKDYLIHIQVLSLNRLQISLYYPSNINSSELYFFSYFIFESPHILLKSFPIYSIIEQEDIYLENRYIGPYTVLIRNFILHNNNTSNRGIASLFIPNSIKRLDCSTGYFSKLLAKGGFGIIWLGRLSNNIKEELVIFKELQHIENIKNCQDFIREVLMMDRLQSKYIIQLIGICNLSESLQQSKNNILNNRKESSSIQNENHMLMVIEYAPLGDLSSCKDILKDKSSLLKLKLILDISRGLNTLHLNNGVKLIHRDVKSQNIFIFSLNEDTIFQDNSIHAKLGDLGCVAISCPCYYEPIGNYQYTAPEALRGSLSVPYSPQIDIYSLGIVLWEILTCKLPFEDIRYMSDPKSMIINGYRPPLESIPDDIPQSIIDLMKNCWHEDPKKRPPFNTIILLLSNILSQTNNINE